MSNIEKKINESATFYSRSFLSFDYQLADFNFRVLEPYFKGKFALELGPASGYMTKHLVKRFESLHLVEGSRELLSQIEDYPNIVKFHSLFENFETDNRYQTIIMSHVLEHIADPVGVLKRIHQWLDAAGVFLVSVPNARSIHRMVAVEMGLLENVYQLNERDHQLGHYRIYDTATLVSHLEEAGFKIRETGGIFLKPLSNGQIEQQWTPEMVEGFFKAGKYFPEHCAEIFAVCEK